MSRMQICRLPRRRPLAESRSAADLRPEAERMLRELAFVYHLAGRVKAAITGGDAVVATAAR